MDLMAMLDIFLPLKTVMEAVQSVSTPAWKIVLYLNKLLNYLRSMSYSPLNEYAKMTHQHFKSIEERKFKGKNNCSFIISHLTCRFTNASFLNNI